MARDFALNQCLAFRRFRGVFSAQNGIMGHGGGRERDVDEIGGEIWGLFGQGGGRAGVVIIARVYLPLLYRFQFRFQYSLGRGGGQDRAIEYGREQYRGDVV